jgi:hypothetical protein
MLLAGRKVVQDTVMAGGIWPGWMAEVLERVARRLQVWPHTRKEPTMKTEYEMSEQDRQTLLDCSKAVPMIALQCGTPASPQENANRAWAALGEKMGFKPMTVEPVPGKGDRFFRAESVEGGGA